MKMIRKYYLIFFGFGFSYLGNWIYLVALNLFVWHLTESPAAMAGIYIVGPIARILTSFIAGSIIDRSNKRKLMILSDISRGVIVLLMPFMESIWLIYLLLFMANIASSFFAPSSTYYITKAVPNEEKQQFNALLGMFNSGSFLIGPALAGGLILLFDTSVAMWVNSLTFFTCAWAIYRLPNVDEPAEAVKPPMTWKLLKKDYVTVMDFVKKDSLFIKIFLFFQLTLMIAHALDSQEATFIKQQLALSDSLYGTMVSVAGVGAIVGGIVAAKYANKFTSRQYIANGLFLTMFFYSLFYCSSTMYLALISFVALGFFMAFSNAGYNTFYQVSVPAEIMGRFGSIANIFQSTIQILFTLIIGLFSEWFTLQFTTISFGLLGVLFALLLYIVLYSKKASSQIKEGLA